jgi:hypothetical protein
MPKKHDTLQEDSKTEQQEVELVPNKFTQQLASPFINHAKSWDNDEHF